MNPVRGEKPSVSANLAVPSLSSNGMKLRAYLYALGGLLWLALPAVAAAAGLVPCAGTACNICDLGQLLQNIVNFSIGISFPIAAVLFAWAGWLYYSNNEDTYKVQRAHKIFTTVFIGFAIVVGGWLIVQTALKTLAPGYQSWTTFDCRNLDRPTNKTIGDLLSQSGVGQVTTPSPPPVSTVATDYTGSNPTVVVCQAGSTYSQAAQNCVNGDGDITAPLSENVASNNGSMCPPGATQVGYVCQVCYGGGYNDNGAPIAADNCEEVAPNPPLSNTDCSVSNIQNAAAAGGYTLTDSQAATLSCIAVPESSCGQATNVAYTPSGQPTSATGMFQIVMGYNDTCHNLNISSCTQAAQAAGYSVDGNLNCSQHFRGGVPIDQIGQACKAAASNIACNASAAACLVQANNGKFTDWTADSRSSRQAQCIQQYSS